MGGVMVRARQGLEELYHEQGDRLWWALLAFTGDREIASDAEAEAFAQALRRGDAIRNPQAWIWTAAFRIAAGQLQERGRSEPIVTEPSYEMPEPAAELADALRRLPAQQRAAIVLHYYADRPIREIAATLGISSATVAVHLHRGRNKLRELLGDDDD